MTFYCRIVILLFSFLALAGCSPNTDNLTRLQKISSHATNQNYFVIQSAYIPDLISNKTDITAELLSIYPQSEYITQYLQKNQDNLQPIHYFYWSNQTKTNPTFVYLRPIQKEKLSLPDPNHTPSDIFFQTKDNFLIISNRSDFFPPIFEPPNQAFLTIFSLDQSLPLPEQISENDLSNIATINTLDTIINKQPICFYFQNNQILINQTNYQTPSAETKLILKDFNSQREQSLYQQIFTKKLLSTLSQFYLSAQNIDFNNIETLTLQQENNNFTFFLQYPEKYDLTSLFKKTTNQLEKQKSYYPQYKILSDGTSSLITSPSNTNVKLNILNDNQISYPNLKSETIYLAYQQNHLILSNYQPWISQNPPTTINIPWSNIQTLYPQLPQSLNFFKSIQLQITKDNFSGIITK